jgi:anti-sigma factor (TIGR02949 family)
MNCAKARFLLYAYLDRDMSRQEAYELARHLAGCPSCQARSLAARGLAKLLHSQVDRTPAPNRLRVRLLQGPVPIPSPRLPLMGLAAVVLFLIIPLATDQPLRSGVSSAGFVAATVVPSTLAAARVTSRRMTGTLVCLTCEARQEAGLCPLPESHHQAGLCADNGEVWRLMSRDTSFAQASTGQTVTVEGVAFLQSGFLRASRVGY